MKPIYLLKDGPVLNVQQNIISFWHFLGMFWAWTECSFVTKHVLSITNFPSCFFVTFPLKYYSYKKFQKYSKNYLLLIYTFIGMIIFEGVFILVSKVTKFQVSKCTFSVGLRMSRNRDGLSWFTSFPFFNKNVIFFTDFNLADC